MSNDGGAPDAGSHKAQYGAAQRESVVHLRWLEGKFEQLGLVYPPADPPSSEMKMLLTRGLLEADSVTPKEIRELTAFVV